MQLKKTDSRIDTYILKSADFAIPILTYLRDLVHIYCPEATETMKWSFPHFEYKGSILCNMASFKQHCSLGFWHGSRLSDPNNALALGEKASMGHLGKIRKIDDLPDESILGDFIIQSMQQIDAGVKVVREPKPAVSKELDVPEYFLNAMTSKARQTFDNFSYSQKKEYVVWITEAKTEATRERRMATAVEWLEEGKIRLWKYAGK
ncbi:YdeI/OmpD-associated family protein [Dyadobacter sp. LJ53]|uniref:YdeI/OmpD-associated family protein n=1 Tax=Dyadobacter chenwenxiniae TaxID=2906456 RepID=UPI001F3DEA9D|nr:YdeI/OmpD-associated family protein [Dyadobacter chenwenxiniae]MCF0053945.1 YdeI/OmpD-associated family protein [Dyadobacter chenwenxiniae]